MINIREVEGGVVISVKVQPNASRDRVVGEYGDQLKIAVTVAPEKGKANKSVIKVLSRLLDVKSSDIEILSGETSRDKKVFIRNISEEEFNRVI
jgi:uncharacterized protein (TIGR00251 family)